jgi:hypothetical protein
MAWIDRLEHRFGRFAIPGLIRIVVIFYALVFILLRLNPYFYEALTLEPAKILRGEVWRLVSYIFIPHIGGGPVAILSGSALDYLWAIFALMFLWMMGESLEAWGSFRLNLYYFTGMIGATIAAFFLGGESTGIYLQLSILFAFATLFPNHTILFMLIIPLQMKWVGWIAFAGVALTFLGASAGAKAAILICLGNYLLFLGPEILRNRKNSVEIAVRRHRFESNKQSEDEPLHRCVICGRTDQSDPDLEFRVGSDGEDYCMEHLDSPEKKHFHE